MSRRSGLHYPLMAAVVLISTIAALTWLGTPVCAQVVYGDSFEPTRTSMAAPGVSASWSSKSLAVTPRGSRHFRGRFGSESIRLNLAGLPQHESVTVTFDLFVIGDWIGNGTAATGPDAWKLTTDDGRVLLSSTFSNRRGAGSMQSYRDNYPKGTYMARSGARESDSLGYGKDSVYPITVTFHSTSPRVGLEFASAISQSGFALRKSWGIDNIQVSLIQNPPPAECPSPQPVKTTPEITLGAGEDDTTPPTAVSVYPADGSTNLPLYTVPTATFSEDLDPATVVAQNFTLRSADANLVPGTVAYDPVTFTATFTPSSDLMRNMTYTATLTTGIKDLAGNAMASDYVWTFTTGGLYETDTGDIVLWGNDDASTSNIVLPFPVSVYDGTYNSFWINNNGNVCFTGALSAYTAFAFPNADGTVIVAPFFADVDTRGSGSGYVHYKATSSQVVITWDQVGYYSGHTDKRNTCQLIMTASGLFGFSYGDLQWTTGDYSGGSGGFGGSPARAGFDSGNGVDALLLWEGNTQASLASIANKTFWYTNHGENPRPNEPPIANAGQDVSLEQNELAGAPVTLDGSGSTDDDLIRPLTFTWAEGTNLLGTGAVYTHRFQYGIHPVTLIVNDGQYSATDEVTVTVTDTTPPDTALTDGPDEGALLATRSVPLAWTGSDNSTPTAELTYSYSYDGGSPVTGPETSHTLEDVADGEHTFVVWSHDTHGNDDPTPSVRHFSVDATPPTISDVSAQPGITDCVITWTTDEPANSQVEYGLTQSYGSQTSLDPNLVMNHSVTIGGLDPDTQYFFKVVSADRAGGSSFFEDEFTTLVDTVEPDAWYTAGPADGGLTCALPVEFAWTGSDNATQTANLTYRYKLDGGDWTNFDASTSISLGTLADGQHTFNVVARDAAGNIDTSPATRTFVLDTAAPVIGSVSATPGVGRCVITWTTDEPSTSQVDYGLSPAYGSTAQQPNRVVNHTVTLTGLACGQIYHYQVRSDDACPHTTTAGDFQFATLDAPDLQVSSISDPGEIWTDRPFDVTWTDLNAGAAAAAPPWIDRIMIASSPQPGGHALGDFQFSQALNPSATVTRIQTVSVPRSQIPADGTYYLIAFADFANATDECGAEGNNWLALPVTVRRTPLPDLIVESIDAPDTAYAGQSISVNVTVKNIGQASTGQATWIDWAYISSDTLPEIEDPVKIPVENISYLGPGESYVATVEMTIPGNLAGDHYILAYTDFDGSNHRNWAPFQVEEEDETNNWDKNHQISILPAPSPDLQVAQVQAPDDAFAAQPILISWKVENRGEGNTRPDQNSWEDAVYLSTDEQFDPQTDRFVGALRHNGGLNKDANYSVQNFSLELPGNVAGNRYIIVVADYNNSVYEQGRDSNNDGHDATPVNIHATPPDLVARIDQAPVGAGAGQPVAVTWTVDNVGAYEAAASGGWADSVYVSDSATFDSSTAVRLGAFGRTASLQPGESYSRTESVMLPLCLAGTYYLFVSTDSENTLFEYDPTYDAEANNLSASSQIDVAATTADLVVAITQSPGTAEAGQSVPVAWSVTNTGAGTTPVDMWTDTVYISQDSQLNTSTDMQLGSFNHSGVLATGAGYTRTEPIAIPGCISGDYYLFVVTDTGSMVPECAGEINNTTAPALVNLVSKSPDLTVAIDDAPADASGGQPIQLTWTTANVGTSEASRVGGWMDSVYISQDDHFDPTNDTHLGSFTFTDPLPAGDDYQRSESVILPGCISGSYYLFVVTDSRNQLIECDPQSDAEANNVSVSRAIEVEFAAPDLQVTSVTNSPSGDAGGTVSIGWSVANAGTRATTETTWFDTVYLSRTSSFSKTSAISIGSFAHGGSLPSQDSYSNELDVTLPGTAHGVYYVFVETDSASEVQECTSGEGNNVGGSITTINVNNILPDLQVQSANVPSNVLAGAAVAVSWVSSNIGTAAISADASWRDAVFFSSDSTLNQADPRLAFAVEGGPLAIGATYGPETSVTIPNVPAGTYYMIFAADDRDLIMEGANEDNNALAIPVQVGIPATDLTVTSITVPSRAYSGTEMPLSWTVRNQGSDPTFASKWVDQVILSRDQVLDTTDPVVGWVAHNGVLAANTSYIQPLSASIPAGLSGRYYIFVRVDAHDQVPEADNQNNTTLSRSIYLELPMMVDLVVTDVQPPANGSPGEAATIQWTVTNMSKNGLQAGRWLDAVYLSTDTSWSMDDKLVGRVEHQAPIDAGASYNGSLNTELPAVAPGAYYVIVRTDVRNAAREQYEDNNTTVSSNRTIVDVPELTLGVPWMSTLWTGKERYAKVNVPDSETLLFTLDALRNDASTELYARHGAMAGRDAYDFIFDRMWEPDQEITVPATSAGWYYSMAGGVLVPPGQGGDTTTAISLKAEIIPFSIRLVTPGHIGDNGQVTITLHGAKFSDDTVVTLSMPGANYTPEKVWAVDSATLKARFVFTNAQRGTYDVTATSPGGETAVATQSVVIEEARPMQLATNASGDLFPRPGRTAFIYATVANTGNVDIQYATTAVTIGEASAAIVIRRPCDTLPAVDGECEDGYGESSLPTFFVRDLAPGQQVAFTVELRNVPGDDFPLRIVAVPSSSIGFATDMAQMAEDMRLYLLEHPEIPVSPNIASLLGDSQAWWDYFATQLVGAGLLPSDGALASLALEARTASAGWPGVSHSDDCEYRCNRAYVVCWAGVVIASGVCLAMTETGPLVYLCWAGVAALATQCAVALDDCLHACLDEEDKCDGKFSNKSSVGPPSRSAGPTAMGFGGGGGSSSSAKVCPPKPKDPNEKAGPVGYGVQAFVPSSQPLLYTVYFENVPTATAAAQRIVIADQLDTSLDPRSVRLKEIGFGSYRYSVPANRSFYQTRQQLGDDLGNLMADINAYVDIATGQINWTLTAIDPATGEQPTGAGQGLLPPNDETGRGQGYLVYTVKPKSNLATGAVISNAATITFDTEEPISTNVVTNTLDAAAPNTFVNALPAQVSDPIFAVSWTGADDQDGSGLKSYDVYVSVDGAEYAQWLANSTATSEQFVGEFGKAYKFYSIGTDNAGNVEQAPLQADASTTVISPNSPPAAADDIAETDQDVPVDIGVLTNDTDPDNDPLTVTQVTQGAHGSVVVNPDNTVKYTPNPGYYGADSFDYTAGDGKGGTDTATVTVTVRRVYPVPAIATISPISAIVGSAGFTLTVNGSGFVEGSQVRWNGSPRTTAFVSSTQLTASVPASDVAAAGSAAVMVVNPTPGGGASKSVVFSVGSPKLIVTAVLSRVGAQILAEVTVKNSGTADASSVRLTTSMLGNKATTTILPQTLGGIAAGASKTATLAFPDSAGSPGVSSVLKVSGTYSGGTFGGSLRVKLP